ncbi:TonB-dependent receptor [Paremcibacter congregatus]|uniref:TonB-dependent receptor n=2 Tax=Paremcibacter congregatus TaxID=2043170 RepID=A0A2G4YR72_9PROT|nr:TonB-dependent receptor [Paremcibacter congregatus]QDE29334.1 TonB-dependent receptor [Paremcibacter congregatus]
MEEILITGSRIVRTDITATSPVMEINEEQMHMDQSVNIEDITRKMPQAAGGANSTGATVGDSLGSSTIDLRGLGQNRTLVLINGTRAVPFSFRNSVDVNSIPAGMLKKVEVLTGGAAAVYGADAVAGVVNFILDDKYDGIELSAGYKYAAGGAALFNAEVTMGSEIQDGRGHISGYIGYSERSKLLAGERDFTSSVKTLIPGEGGNFTDVASGNFFAYDGSGNMTTTRQTTDVTAQRYLIQPLKRMNAGVFFNYDVVEDVAEVYGRAMFSQVKVTGAGSTGQTPVSVNEVVTITNDNPFLSAEAAALLTFNGDGEALVNVERNLGLGLQETKLVRNTFQVLVGVRGDLADNVRWDISGQYGRTDGTATVYNNGIRTDKNGNSRFGAIANTVDIFGPGTDLSSLSSPIIHSDRERTQSVISGNLTGTSADIFELPAGPIGFAVGYEYRKEEGAQTPGSALSTGTAYGLGGIGQFKDSFDTNEIYGELLVPLLNDLPFIQELNAEGAYRTSDYSNTGKADTYKLGLSWAVNDDLRFRGTRQTAIRSPNLGEFASPETALSLALFDPESPSFIPRLGGRFDGDPCLDGRGDATQCALFGAAAPGTAFDTSKAIYTFGGNPDIKPEEAVTYTLGFVYTPNYLDGMSLTVDYYNIKITDAVSQIQPISALTNCYIDNPTPDNPLCGAVLRDSSTGLISKAIVNDFNLASLKQAGLDVGFQYRFNAPEGFGESMQFGYQGNIVLSQSRQNNATVEPIDCKATFGTSCTGDFASVLQAGYKHRVTLDWSSENVNVQLGWRRIGSVKNVLDETDVIDAQNYVDIAAVWNITESYQLTAGIENIFDKKPPLPASNSNLYGTVSDYDVIGTTVGLTFRIRH